MAPALRAIALALRASTACPASPTCPENDQCSLTSNRVTFQVSCATDYYGGDLQLAQTSSLASCTKACSTITGCIAASYVNGNCYLKSTLNAAQPNPSVIGVAVVGREDSTPPEPAPAVPKTCPKGFTCPEDDGCSYTSGLRTLTLTCGVDFYGGDLANEYSASLEACTQSCANNAQCVAASFVGGKGAGSCYLKDAKNGGSRNDNVDAVYVLPSVVQPSISATSSTPSPSSTVASSIVESSAITSSAVASSTIAPSTAVSSSTPPGPIASNFCLKVMTPGILQTGFIAKFTGPNTNIFFQGPANGGSISYPVGFFNLEQSGALSVVDTDRVIGIPYVPSAQSQVLRQFSPTQLAIGLGRPYTASCSLVGSELKCIVRTIQNVLNTFFLPTSPSALSIFSIGTEGIVAAAVTARQVNLGVAFGADCIV